MVLALIGLAGVVSIGLYGAFAGGIEQIPGEEA